MTRWKVARDADAKFTMYLEFGDDGLIARQVELQGDDQEPITASDNAESTNAYRAGRLDEYVALYGTTGVVALHQLSEPGEPDWLDLTENEFQVTWDHARATLAAQDPDASRWKSPS